MPTLELQPVSTWQRPLRDADFYAARSVDEALALAAAHPGARFLAGGTALVRFDRWGGDLGPALIYIGRIPDLQEIREHDDGRIFIGSAVTHNRLRAAPALRERASLLRMAADEIAGPAVRNLATIGGNICVNWDLVPALLALDARVHLRGGGGARVVPLGELYDSQGQPRIQPGELLEGVSVAGDLPRQAYQRVARRRAVSRGIAGAAVALDLADGVCRGIRIGIGGAGLFSRRLGAVEGLLRGQVLSDTLVTRAGELAYESAADAFDDLEAQPWYTREMARVTTERAINAAAGRAVL